MVCQQGEDVRILPVRPQLRAAENSSIAFAGM
jgi:hypothetical protein